MYVLKTKETDVNVRELLDTIENEKKKEDGYKLLEIFEETTGFKGKIWGGNMIGFGKYHYKYASGHEGEYFQTGFAVRKTNITLYLMMEEKERAVLVKNLGKHKLGKGCIYINKLGDVNIAVIKDLIRASEKYLNETYPNVEILK